LLYTTQLAQVRKVVKTYPDAEVIDITAKSGQPPWDVFAPTWDIIREFKHAPHHKRSEQRFKRQYLSLLRKRWRIHAGVFREIAAKAIGQDIVLGCYCQQEMFCHRFLLVNILTKIEPSLIYGGELPENIEPPFIEQSLFGANLFS
jgi:uncharacterized protein YeaO (DUF488 family)